MTDHVRLIAALPAYVFSPISSHGGRTGGASEGAIALRKFLKYAQTGELADFGIITKREPDSDFEIAVAQVLKNRGYNIVPQVGVAGYFVDIGVCHPHRNGEYILGIECDGATYHSSRFARDRDRLREEVLKRRGWNIHRIWSADWFKNRGTCVEHLINKLDNLVKADSHVVTEFQEIEEEAEQVSVLTGRKERMFGDFCRNIHINQLLEPANSKIRPA